MSLTRPVVLGILNITPDSFYSASRNMEVDGVLIKAKQMIDEGAWALDIGGMSSRPGASILTPEEEWSRIEDVLKELQPLRASTYLSLDTLHASTADKALSKGWVDMINDISGGVYDKKMYEVVAHAKVPYILMDMPGIPKTMQDNLDSSRNIVNDVLRRLQHLVHDAHEAGIQDIIVDMGFGFGKTLAQNFELLEAIDHFTRIFNEPICVGVSRKSMITKTLNIDSSDALNGTTVLHSVALLKGAFVLRCHDVHFANEAIQLINSLKTSSLD